MELRSIQLDLTSVCNQGCEFCPYHGTYGVIEEGGSIPYSAYERLIIDLSKMSPKPVVKIAGSGESTLYKDFNKVLTCLKERELKVRLITNGVLLESKAEFLHDKLSSLIVSVHGDEEEHNRVTKFKNAYSKAIAGIKKIRTLNPDLEVILHLVITPQNYKLILKHVQTAKDLNIIPRIQHLKFTKGNDEMGKFDLSELKNIIIEAKNQCPELLVEPDLESEEIDSYYDVSKDFILNPFSCWRVLSDVPVRFDGNVMTCDDRSMGNICEKSINEILQGEIRRKFVEKVQSAAASDEGLPSFCSRCCYNSKSKVTRFSA